MLDAVEFLSQAIMELRPVHGPLPILGEGEFHEPVQLHRVVTFLNRTFKGRGYVFGLRVDEDGTVRLTVYGPPGADRG